MSRRKLAFLCLILLSACATASPEDAQMANALCDQGRALLAAGEIRQARDIYLSATTRDPDNARAWNGLGVTDDMLGKREEAKNAYQHAADLAPDDRSITNNLAHLALETGNYDDAIHVLEPHINDANVPPAMRQNLAEAYAATGREADAENLLRTDLPPAQVAERLESYRKLAQEQDSYADLGSSPTEAMAQAHIAEARQIAGSDASGWKFSVVPDIKVTGGTPVFTVRITGESPTSICAAMSAQALPCIPHGK